MAATIFVDGKKATKKGNPKTVGQLLRLLSLSPEEALVKVDGSVRPEGASICGAKKVEVIRVVFGG